MIVWGAIWGAILGLAMVRYGNPLGFMLGAILGALAGRTLRSVVRAEIELQRAKWEPPPAATATPATAKFPLAQESTPGAGPVAPITPQAPSPVPPLELDIPASAQQAPAIEADTATAPSQPAPVLHAAASTAAFKARMLV